MVNYISMSQFDGLRLQDRALIMFGSLALSGSQSNVTIQVSIYGNLSLSGTDERVRHSLCKLNRSMSRVHSRL